MQGQSNFLTHYYYVKVLISLSFKWDPRPINLARRD